MTTTVIEAAVLTIRTDSRPPGAEFDCRRCGEHFAVRGRDEVRDFVCSQPIARHRQTCPATAAPAPAQMRTAA